MIDAQRFRRYCVLVAVIACGIAVNELHAAPQWPWARAQADRVRIEPPAALAPAINNVRAAPNRGIGDRKRAALVAGVAFGRADEIDAATRDDFRKSGLAHLLAASGQNIALVIAMCVVCARLVGAGRMLGLLWSLAAIPAYVLVVGGGPSIVRAAIVGVLGVVAWLAGIIGDALHLLLVAAALLVWAFPMSHRGLGFQLSFACAGALILCVQRVARALDRSVQLDIRYSWAAPLRTALVTGLAATIVCSVATTPILLLRVGEAPLVGPAANIVAIPLAGGVLAIASAATAIAYVHPVLARPLWELASALAYVLQAVAHGAAALPYSSAGARPWVSLAIAAALVAVVRRRRRVSNTGLAAIAAGALLAAVYVTGGASAPAISTPLQRLPPPKELRIVFLDVGQGDAILVITPEHAVLVDTGVPESRVVNKVRALGVRKLDALLLTHSQLDHAGAAREVVDELRPAWVGVPKLGPHDFAPYMPTGVSVRALCAGDRIGIGAQVSITVYSPPCSGSVAGTAGDALNDASLVTVVERATTRIALTADAEGAPLLASRLPRVDIFKMPHHGSADPLLPAILARTQPSLSVISSGVDNTYGHPAPSALAAIAAQGAAVARTDQLGTIVIDVTGARFQVYAER